MVVDIVVSNGKGEPFTGLKQEDFEVLEDGNRSASPLSRSTAAPRPTILSWPARLRSVSLWFVRFEIQARTFLFLPAVRFAVILGQEKKEGQIVLN